MITFKQSADPCSVVVMRLGRDAATSKQTEHMIAMLQWHDDRAPRIVPCEGSFTLEEAVEMTDKLAELAGRVR